MFRIIIIFLSKDFSIEFNEKINFFYTLILLSTFSLIFTSFLESDYILFSYFMTLLITNMILSQRIARSESSNNQELVAYNLPIDLSVFCISKILFNIFIYLLQAILLVLFYNLFSQNYKIDISTSFILFTLVYVIGLACLLTTFSLMLERIKSEGQFMFISIYPLVLPFLFLSFNSLDNLFLGSYEDLINSFNFQVLLAFDILMFAICPILFSYAIRR